jgi:non-homologous end joining protein Ku
MRVIKAKVKGRNPKLKAPEKEPADSGVLDLMSKLRASLDQGGAKSKAHSKRKTVASREKRTARKRKTA